ncbi:MAG TPA: hypothetical protein P5567_04765 [Kiritimatiellia bacterium]|nr:hypothetical protein [Kiritimatiellia bacterium]HSA17442.1 hypothetical protein [Kiritimatiellia bacterium]
MKSMRFATLAAIGSALTVMTHSLSTGLARASAVEDSRAELVLFTSGDSVGAGVHTEFSTWSDLTAFFRPSRWKNPFAVGGTLSWLNFGAWGEAPGRTAKVLAGEAVVAGTITAVIIATGDSGGDDDDSEPTTDGHTGASYKAGRD